jgi:hypothetical protein
MKPRRPRLLIVQESVFPAKPRRVRPKKRVALSLTSSAFDFNEPLSIRIGRGESPEVSFSEAVVEPSVAEPRKTPVPRTVEPSPPAPRIESDPSAPEPIGDDEGAREDLRAVADYRRGTQEPVVPPPPGLVTAHDVFDRMSRGEPPPPPRAEEGKGTEKPAPPTRGHDIFDRMDLSRAATFDVGTFPIEQALDRFDQILEPKPARTAAPAPDRVDEVDTVEDVATIIETIKSGIAAPASPAAKEPEAESLTASGLRFVTDVDSHGWLKIKWEDGTTYPDVLPFQLKVDVTKIEDGREHFTVREGLLKGKKGSVKLKSSDGASYLSKTGEHKGPAGLELDLAAATITIKDVGTFSAELDSSNPIPKGTYDLEVPFEIHHLADRYLKDSPFATTWFRIGHSGDRFLHPGSVSAGCATVLDHAEWTKIYNHLVRSRKDDQSIGTMVVK